MYHTFMYTKCQNWRNIVYANGKTDESKKEARIKFFTKQQQQINTIETKTKTNKQ